MTHVFLEMTMTVDGFTAAPGVSHDHPLGIGRSNVVEESICPAGQSRELIHHSLDDCWSLYAKGIRSFARLKENVGVLRSASNDRMVRA